MAAGSGAAGLPGQRRAARASPRAGAPHVASTTSLFLDPLAAADTRELIASAAARCRRQAGRARGARRARGGQSAVRRGDGPAARRGRKQQGGRAARHRAGSAGRAAGFARAAGAPPRRPRGRRRPDLLGGRARRRWRRPREPTCRLRWPTLREKDIIVPGEGRAAGRRAGARVQARADPRRRLRDAAEGGARAQALRGRHVHRTSAPASAGTRSSRCWPSTTAAPPRSARRCTSTRASWLRCAARRCSSSRRPATRRAPCTPTRRRWPTTSSPPPLGDGRPRPAGAHAREAGRPGAAAGSGRRRDRGVGAGRSSTTPSEEDLEHVAELHRKIGAALAHKGERTEAIQHHQQGINLIKDGPPSLALVRLYEEAAWLYMQVGDNMLAIYASEKALRLAERLGEVRAASRAHGIFGRVFGRIGDTAKARENLERAIELAQRLRRERDRARDARARPPPRERRGRLRGGRALLRRGARAGPTHRRRARADRAARRARAARLLPL